MVLSWDEFDKSRKDYDDNWAVGEMALYDLCQKRCRDHSNRAFINAKLYIIGRALATGIERKVPSSGKQGSSMNQVSNHIFNHKEKLEDIFRSLSEISEPLDTENKVKQIITEHGKFVTLISEITRGKQTARSFASKYMHFHCSAVPIFDSVAARILPKLYPRNNETFKVFDLPANADGVYGRFAIHIWNLYLEARKNRQDVNIKSIDTFLLWMASN